MFSEHPVTPHISLAPILSVKNSICDAFLSVLHEVVGDYVAVFASDRLRFDVFTSTVCRHGRGSRQFQRRFDSPPIIPLTFGNCSPKKVTTELQKLPSAHDAQQFRGATRRSRSVGALMVARRPSPVWLGLSLQRGTQRCAPRTLFSRVDGEAL